jgi:hypothetical protein
MSPFCVTVRIMRLLVSSDVPSQLRERVEVVRKNAGLLEVRERDVGR